MNDVEELKQFAMVHAKAQNLPPELYEAILAYIHTDQDGGKGSWSGAWSAAARELEITRSELQQSYLCYGMARFPFIDGVTRQAAYDNCLRVFDRWRQEHPAIEPVDVELAEGRFRCWAAGLSATDPKPLVLVMGGIVSLKEQWAPILLQAEALGMAMLVAELPGVGENTLPYDAGSWRMLSAVLDAVAKRADVTRTYAVANSFSGHLALRCACEDPRIRGIVTTGAPVTEFFTDAAWQRQLPTITVDTLARLTATPAAGLHGVLREWALTEAQLAGLDIPVAYTASLRDEIIPAGDTEMLRKHVRALTVNEFDDVHASPAHVEETMRWTVESLFAMFAPTPAPPAP
jgi:pimeloyl-ACP methyl ester carboxylesterase